MRTTRRPKLLSRLLPGLAAVALAVPAVSLADEGAGTTANPASETTSSAPAPEPLTTSPAGSTAEPAPAPAGPAAPGTAAAPQVQGQHPQSATPATTPARGKSKGPASGAGATGATGVTGSSSEKARAPHSAPSPGTLTPSLPLSLESSISGIPGFFIESFRIPPFLLPIYQAAGTAYGIPWQVLAAINEVETDYGRDLSVSSAGAEGWMQFLPAEWEQYGVDANGAGFKDPYNPADAIFAAARYLRAAGGETNIRSAVYSYNHSQAYVDTVMLRAQLLGGSPPELLGALTALTEARFPVHAPSHFADGFPTAPASAGAKPGAPAPTLVGTTIYSKAGAPVIAVQDGEITEIGDSPSLGRFVSLKDAYGNTYIYAQLGEVAALYPVLVPRDHPQVSARITQPAGTVEPAPSGPATAGAQPRSPLSESASVTGLALGAAAPLETVPPFPVRPAPAVQQPPTQPPPAKVRVFREGSEDVYLHPLRAGVQVIAGTVLGHIGTDASESAATGAGAQGGGPHMLFQIRPAGVQAPLIDPKPILDGWVALENTSIFRAKGENPFLATSPTVGQVLLESKQQLEPQVLRDPGIQLGSCGRQDVQAGGVDKHILAMLEFLSVSGLKPTVSGLRCGRATAAETQGNVGASSGEDALNITAVNGVAIAGHDGPGSITDIVVRRLLRLEGLARPSQIVSVMSYPGATNTLAKPSAQDIHVSFSPSLGPAHAAGAFDSTLTPGEWTRLIARLGEIPNPTVSSAPSSAAIPDKPGAPGSSGKEPDGND